MRPKYDVIVVGAGAAGLMCAITAAQRGRRVGVIDHAKKIGTKSEFLAGVAAILRISMQTPHTIFLRIPTFVNLRSSNTPSSTLSIGLKRPASRIMKKARASFFCDRSAQDIVDMLINRSRETGVDLLFPVGINGISHDIDEAQYILDTTHGTSKSDSLVIATGGLSIPRAGRPRSGTTLRGNSDTRLLRPEQDLSH